MDRFPAVSTRVRTMLASAAVSAIVAASPAAAAAPAVCHFDLPEQSADQGIPAFARQANMQIIIPIESARRHRTNAVRGEYRPDEALRLLLAGTGLAAFDAPPPMKGTIVRVATPVAAQTAPPQEPEAVPGDIVVTAQKRSERIQDVPIAISAFTQETLDKQKIEAGPDILKAVPNLTFSKSNFAGYNLSIRGIGTKAISVTTDPGVAINFNSTTLITNRFFEQEFFDLERIEVLRGPQGTLYGRNATGGVVNIISNKADLTKFDGYLKAEVGNFGSRRAQGAINVPIVPDVLGLRLAGAYTNRDGFTTNDITMNRIDGRDLYTTRLTASLKPSSRLRSDFVWERFSENDNRARTAKQLCHRDPGNPVFASYAETAPTLFAQSSQGCKDGSLYDDGAYGVPHGLSLPYVIAGSDQSVSSLGGGVTLLKLDADPYASTTQTHDLRRISSVKDPLYKAHANVFELNTTLELTNTLSVTAQTAYNKDSYYSTQDYNRFNTVPIFNSSTGVFATRTYLENGEYKDFYIDVSNVSPGGYLNDPQLGPSNRIVVQDLVNAKSKQFSQEVRLSTMGAGPFQATFGGNYTHYKNHTDYYVFSNVFTGILAGDGPLGQVSGPDVRYCYPEGSRVPVLLDPPSAPTAGCAYIDPNPLSKINGKGHNYFRSSNRFHLNSYGIFGDGTYALSSAFKLIAGIRYNDDIKVTTPVPSQLLLSTRPVAGGTTGYGYPENPKIRQHFKAITGRAGFQWFPQLSFADEAMLYFTYSRGYKAGGTNPPGVGFNERIQLISYPADFRPEYVNSLEAGFKSTMLNRELTLNVASYFYDFKNYQVSQIQDRQAVNENFDTTMYGLEMEADWQPSRALRINANVGLQNTKLGKNQFSIDVMDRLQGHGDQYAVLKPFILLPSNCVVSLAYADGFPGGQCPGSYLDDPSRGQFVKDHPEIYPNGGRGFFANVGGNEVPNAPHFTTNVGVEYNIPFATNWVLTPRVDGYHQSGSWARVYNDQIDRLRGWENVNVSIRAGNPELGLLIEAYVKNVFDGTPITDAFINSDDTGLTTNVFTFDPRIVGVNVTKKF